uniref:Uncharacterized protein n=1 Tax=Strix occidentalis caurina TaxID=311401 RepID=A0A8D0FWZ3_STROC
MAGWQTTGATGSLQKLKKFNNQDFNHLRTSCLSQGVLFEDATFPAHVSSIGPNLLPEDKLRRIQWKRQLEKIYLEDRCKQGMRVWWSLAARWPWHSSSSGWVQMSGCLCGAAVKGSFSSAEAAPYC